jgi:hypothetical protein
VILAILLLSIVPRDDVARESVDLIELESVKITGRGCYQHPVPKHALAVRSQGMSEQQSSCNAPVEKSGTVEYRDIPGFPGYRVGSDGTVWTSKLTNHGVTDTWRLLKPKTSSQSEHVRVCLSRDGRNYLRFVHRLVLEAFVGPPPDGMTGRHFPDRNPTNNDIINLQWGTQKENCKDRDIHGTTCCGEIHPKAVLTEEIVLQIRHLAADGATYAELSERFGCQNGTLWAIRSGRTWKHVGGPITKSGSGNRKHRRKEPELIAQTNVVSFAP